MAVMVVLLVVSPITFASEMKEYRNDNEHYSFLIPNDFKFQDFKIDNPTSNKTTNAAGLVPPL
ncbi:MAG: hypothetical protein K0Q53_298 [Massilibacillus sp.]|jgi:hypothetical protein|nr:hypothetical protein [Massilibacillus sp.]